MSKADDILKKYGITQVRGSEGSNSSPTNNTNTPKVKGTGNTKAAEILSKYGITQVRGAEGSSTVSLSNPIGSAQSWIDSSNTFLKDAQQYLGSWRTRNDEDEDYTSLMNRSSSLIAEAYNWRNQYAGDDEAISYIDEVLSALSDTRGSFKDYLDYYSQWDSEESYKKWMQYNTPEKRQEQYEKNQTRLEELQKQQRESRNHQPGNSPYLTGESTSTSSPYGAALQGQQVGSAISNTDKEIAQIKKEMRLYEIGEADADGFYYGSKVVDDYGKYLKNDAFVSASENREYQNADRAALDAYDVSQSEGSLALTNGGYFDEEGNIRNAKGTIVQYASAPEVQDKLGLFLSASDDDIVEAYNILSASNGNYETTWADIMQEGDTKRWKYLKDDELKIYYGLLKTEGQESAYRYLDAMEVELGRRETAEIYAAIEETSGLEQVMLNVASVPMNMIGGIAATVDNATRLVKGEDINPYSRAQTFLGSGNYIRYNTAQEINDATGNKEIPGLGFTLGDAYQAGMSMVDSLVGARLGGKTYQAVMSMGAASTEMARLYSQGASMDQMVLGAVAAGAAEWVFEKYSIENLIDMKSPETLGQFLKNAFIQGGIEMSEEAATEFANILTNGLIMQSESDWAKVLEENGGDYGKAAKEMAIRIANAGLSGFLSGVGSGSLQQGMQYGAQQQANAELGKYISGADSTDALLALALDMASGESGRAQNSLRSQSQDIMDDAFLTKGGKNRATGRLYNTVRSVVTEQNISEISAALQEKGFSKKDATAIAGAVAVQANGIELSDKQQKVLKKFGSNEDVQSVLSEVMGNEESGINQRAKSIAKFEFGAMRNHVASQIEQSLPGQENVDASDNVDAQSEKAIESSYEVSADGKTILNSTGDIVNIREVADIKDGRMTLRLDDGSTVDAGDVSYASEEEALVYETVAQMGASTRAANILVNGFKSAEGLSASAYAHGIEEAFRYGMYNDERGLAKSVFASKLNPGQRDYAYRQGQKAAGKQVAKEQATVRENRTAAEAVTSGKVHFDGDRISLTKRQRASLDAMEKIADTLGVQIYVFESKLNEKGQRVGANGWYNPKDHSIHIDLHAGANGEGTMLFTLAHELTHFIKQWSPAKFKTLANFLMKEYGQKNVSAEELVQKQIAKAKRAGRTISYDTAYEEVVADSMETMLSDGKVMEKLEKLKQQDKTLWQKIKDFISDLAAKIRSVYKGMAPDSVEGRYVAEMKDAIEKLQDMFTEALVEASENYQASEQVLAESGIAVNAETDSGSLLSVRDVLNEDERTKVAKALADRFGVTEKEASKWLTAETSLASLILNPKYSAFLDYEADPDELAIKQNSDYPQGTVDFSNICKKRREFTQVMNRILRNFPNHVFAATDLAKIRTIMGQEGMTLPCGICYVEDRRQLDTIVAQDFIDGLKLYREGSKTRPDGKPFNANQLKGLQLTDGDTYVPTIYELVTLEGRNSLKDKNPNMEAAWVKYNNARGMQSVRLLTNEAEYKRQILKYSPKTVQTKNDYGGLRIYSFSDMEMFHLIDIIQVLTDSAAVGLKVQGYTKVNEYAKAVKDTGEKLNRSLIPKGDLGYRIENGKVVLEYDPVEGIDIYSEDFFDSKDNPNVGNIVIGINATQIRAAMRSDFIDYIIPFHTGQSAEVLGEKGIAAWNNYKDSQSEIDIATGKKSKHQINIYTEVFQAAEAEGKPIQNKRDFVNKFLAVCKENGLQPRFSEFLNTDENGDYVYTEGYHKFLVDFKTFAQTEIGEYLPQMPVKPIFDDAYITGLLEAYVEEQKAKDAEVAKQMPKVIERITNEIVKPDRDTADSEIRYSVRDAFYKEFDAWDKKDTHVSFVTGTTSDVLKSIGMKDQNIVLRSGTVLQKLKDHPEMTFDIFKGIPELLEHPVIVQFSDAIDPKTKRPKYDSSITVLGELYADVVEDGKTVKKPVLVSLELLPTKNKGTTVLDFAIIKSAYSKNALQQYLNENSILYIDPDKKRTDSWLSLTRLQLPFGEKRYGSIRKIAYVDGKVKVQSPKNMTDMQKRLFEAGIIDEFGNKLFSDRDTESVSNRSLLANAFESVVTNPIEKRKLQEYKDNISLINAEEKKLQELRGQIKELSFAKGPKDTKKIRDLQFDAQQTANRIDTYDKILLRMEVSAPLQNVLNREKEMVRKREEQKRKEALAEYREKATKTQRELLDRWQESRKKGIESREKTAMRHKIKGVVNDLNQYLLKGTKERHVPIGLQKAVAEALNAVNMDTIGAEERIAKLQQELMKAKTPEAIQEISKKIDHIREMGDRMDEKLKKLKTAYDEFINSDDPLIANSHDDAVSAHMMRLIVRVGDTPLRDMTVDQLQDVYDVYKVVLATIRNANKSFKDNKNRDIATRANQVMAEIDNLRVKRGKRIAGFDWVEKFGWDNLKPVYAMERIGSRGLIEAYKNVRAGEDTWARDIVEAREFYLEKFKRYRYDSWDFETKHAFTSTTKKDFELTLDQIMSLYAYSKRDQAEEHLRYGGIVFDPKTEVVEKTKSGIKVKYNVANATAYNISAETLGDIISKLTDEQKGFVDEMQAYLSDVMGAKGNEVSLAMYDLKLFREKHYFPLKSAHQYMAKAKEQAQGDVKIKNSGFSKETKPHAKNPIVLSSFMDVWTSHVNEMSMYHAFVLPMEDFYRIYNYTTPSKAENMPTEGVNAYIENAYGSGATGYIEQMLKDLNGGARSDSRTGFINKMMGMFKKGAVFASASVVVQQPSAIARAAALVDIKHFTGPKVDAKRHKQLWDEVKKYAPVAIIKEMGYFDTNMGKSTQDFILGKEYSGFSEKMKALVTDSNYRDEVLSKAPALADEMAWCMIWEAVKRETVHKRHDLSPKSEEFLKLVGERFTEVIVKTQVYDSVLARSANMRSKDTGMKMATAFMAEPTTSINMIGDALLKGKRGDKKYARKAIGSVVASVILNSFLVAFVQAARDDDEEESYAEKYIGTFTAEVLDGLNPLTYIPFIKDIVSIVQGYEVERSDMSVISDIVNAVRKLSSDKVSGWKQVEDFAGSICQIFGLPVKNIMRDTRALWQAFNTIVNGEKTTGRGIGYAVKEAITGKSTSNPDQLYESRLAGDAEHTARVEARYAKGAKDAEEAEDSANAAVRQAIKNRFIDGEIDTATALKQMVLYAGMDASEAHWLMDAWEYRKAVGTDEGYSKYNDFFEAVKTGKNLKAVIKEYTSNGVKEKTLSSMITDHFKPEYVKMTASERASIKGYLINALEQCGVDRKDAEARLADWDFEAKHGFSYSNRKESYLEGEVSAAKLRTILIDFGGYSEEDADAQIEAYDWMAQGYEDVTSAAVKSYNEYCASVNVPKDVYLYIRSFSNNTENDVDEATGKTINYSAMKKIMAEIDAQPGLTAAQKTAIARSLGWSDKNIQKYKLW